MLFVLFRCFMACFDYNLIFHFAIVNMYITVFSLTGHTDLHKHNYCFCVSCSSCLLNLYL